MDLEAEHIWVLILIAVALLIVVLNDRTKERAVRQAEREGRRPERRYLNYKTSWLLVLMVIVVAVVAVFVGGRNVPQVSPAIIYGIFAAGAALFVVLVIILRRRNRVHLAAVKMAQQGNVDGAIALLQEHMEQKGPSAMVFNNLAVFRGMQGRWAESLELIEQAELHGVTKALYLGNKGLALWKLGRLEDALPFLKEAATRSRTGLAAICNYGLVLVELGKHDEALEQLRRADQIFARYNRYLARLDCGAGEVALKKLRAVVSPALE